MALAYAPQPEASKEAVVGVEEAAARCLFSEQVVFSVEEVLSVAFSIRWLSSVVLLLQEKANTERMNVGRREAQTNQLVFSVALVLDVVVRESFERLIHQLAELRMLSGSIFRVYVAPLQPTEKKTLLPVATHLPRLYFLRCRSAVLVGNT